MPFAPASRPYRFCDLLTEGLIYFAILFGPWAFGTTQNWSIHVMNGVGLTLGLLWLGKLALRNVGFQAQGFKREAPSAERERQFTWMLAAGTFLVLLYCLISAVNARAIYHPEEWSFEYRNSVPWLPHSYDQATSWAAFWKYLGLAGLFWALRDWLLAPPVREHRGRREADGRRTDDAEEMSVTSDGRLPVRLRRLFWVMTFNGTVLAFQGLIQRAEGGNQLLWLVEPRIGKTADFQFGPYAYRANAAQYFNLLWPAVLGFWWASVRSLSHHSRMAVLLPCVLIMAICPLVSASRGGAIVLVTNLIMAGGILWLAQWRSHWTKKALLFLLLSGVVGGGALLGWKTLAPRMEMIEVGYDGREGLYPDGRYMAQDNAWFGTGPGTFETMYQLYNRFKPEDSVAQMHNDWLETRITFGWLGATPIFLTLLLVLMHWFGSGGGIHGNKYFVMLLWVALGGCLVHAAFDFPFQIHSILTLFLVLCAVLSCLSRRLPARVGGG